MADLKGIGKKAISIFWREKEEQTQDLGPNLAPSPSASASPATTAPAYSPLPESGPMTSDNPFYKDIEKELLKNMPPAFGELNVQMAEINEKFSSLDQATRDQLAFHAAHAALKARQQNLTVADVLQALDGGVKSLSQEEAQFNIQNEQGFKDKLAAVRQKISQLKQGISMREKRLVEVQKELDAFIAARNEEKKKLEAEKAQLLSDQLVTENEINQIEQKKGEREANFRSAMQTHMQNYSALRERLAANLQKLK